MTSKFSLKDAMSKAWEEAVADYRSRGIDPEDVLERASQVIFKLRGTEAQEKLSPEWEP